MLNDVIFHTDINSFFQVTFDFSLELTAVCVY